MQSKSVFLTSKYTYVRCDFEFSMLFTNGKKLEMWRGFYCFLTEQLQEYCTNGAVTLQTVDNAVLWWLCTDTLIMSVTDINNVALNSIGSLVAMTNELVNQQTLSELNQSDYQQKNNNLLQSIQNTLSIFINAYVEANSVQDFGFIQGTINNDLTCNVYIAKANKFSFNCRIDYSHNFTKSYRFIIGVRKRGPINGCLYYMNFDNPSITLKSFTVVRKFGIISPNVCFALLDNLKVLQTGYAVSNVSAVGSMYVSPGQYIVDFVADHGVDPSYSIRQKDNIDVSVAERSINCMFDSVNSRFVLSLSEVSNSFSGNVVVGDYKPFSNTVSCSEKLSISFDVDKN